MDIEGLPTGEHALSTSNYDSAVAFTSISLSSKTGPFMTNRSAWFNIMNITVGAGCLALPFAMKLCGVVLGVVMIVLSGLSAAFTVELLLWTAVITNESSYQTVALRTIGRACAMTVGIMIVLMCFSCVLSYIILIGDLIPSLLMPLELDSIVVKRNFVMGVAAFGIILPLSLVRSYHLLRYAGMVAISMITYVVVVVVVWAFTTNFDDVVRGNVNNFPNPTATPRLTNWSPNILFAIPIMCFAFTSHIQVYGIFREMGHRSVRRMMKVIWCSILADFILYLCISIFAYFTFYDVTDGNLLNNFTEENITLAIILGKVGLAIALCCSGPIFVPPIRESLYGFSGRKEQMSVCVYVTMTLMIILCAYGLAVAVRDVENVIALTGCVCSTTIMYIMPSLFYIALRKQVPSPTSRAARCRLCGAWVCLFVGIFVMITGTFASVGDFAGFLVVK